MTNLEEKPLTSQTQTPSLFPSWDQTQITPIKTTRANKLPLSYKTYQTPLLFPLEASHSQYQYSAVFPFLLQAWELVSFPTFKKSIVSASKQHFTVTTIDYTNHFWIFKVK